MKIINYISVCAMPIFILLIIIQGTIEKKNTFDVFIEGAKEGVKIVFDLFPTLLGLFLAIGLLKSSGIMDFFISILSPIAKKILIPEQILPLIFIRPISGSASTAIATNIMNVNGVDTLIGKIASVIMGSTETTLYTIAVYTSCVKIKKTNGILIAALLADIVSMIVAIVVCNIL